MDRHKALIQAETDIETASTKCRLQTADCRLGLKCRQGTKCRLQTGFKMQTEA